MTEARPLLVALVVLGACAPTATTAEPTLPDLLQLGAEDLGCPRHLVSAKAEDSAQTRYRVHGCAQKAYYQKGPAGWERVTDVEATRKPRRWGDE